MKNLITVSILTLSHLGFAATGDLTSQELLQYGQVEIVDLDPEGLNCHWDFENPDPSTAAKLHKGEKYNTSTQLSLTSAGKAYVWLWYDASGCYVRANRKYVKPVADFHDITETYFEGEPGLVFVVADAEGPLNCRINLSSQFEQIAFRFQQGDLIGFGETEVETRALLKSIAYRNGKPWAQIVIAQGGGDETTCYIRANTRYIRDLDAREFLN